MDLLNLTETEKSLASGIKNHIEKLALQMPNRHPGSDGNKMATEYFRKAVEQSGFQTECEWFDCIDWQCGIVTLESYNEKFHTLVSPYSLPCIILQYRGLWKDSFEWNDLYQWKRSLYF